MDVASFLWGFGLSSAIYTGFIVWAITRTDDMPDLKEGKTIELGVHGVPEVPPHGGRLRPASGKLHMPARDAAWGVVNPKPDGRPRRT